MPASEQARLMVEAIKKEFAGVLKEELPPELPPWREINHKIEIIPGAEPPNKAPYRMSEEEYQELQKQLERLLALGHIRPSNSP